MSESMKSNMAIVKGMGAAGNGTERYIAYKRCTWMMLFLWPIAALVALNVSLGNDMTAINMLSNPLLLILFMVFASAGLLQGMYGMELIIEDYVHHAKWRGLLLSIIKIITYISLLAGCLSALVMHLVIITSF